MKARIVACALAFSAFAANAQELWRGAEVGMTVEQVSKLIPEALPGTGLPEASGRTPRLKVPLRLDNDAWMATLMFVGEGLTEIIMSPVRDIPPSTAGSTFNSVSESLRSKYGPEVSSTVDRSAGQARRVWRAGQTTITLSLRVIGRDYAHVGLHYEAAGRGDAGKL